jgi:AcrR family transcriptional regulator
MTERRAAAGKEQVRAADVASRSTATRNALITAARRLFAEKGYFQTGTEELVAAARVGTRGALYHHFTDKRALFIAVYEQIQAELVDAANKIAEGDPISRMRAGLIALLEASLTPEVQRILIIDGPVVLGSEDNRSFDEEHGLATMRGLLRRAIDEGVIAPLPVEAMSHFLLAGTRDAALYIATAENPAEAKEDAISAVNRILVGLTSAAK